MGRTACTEPQCLYRGVIFLHEVGCPEAVSVTGYHKCEVLRLRSANRSMEKS